MNNPAEPTLESTPCASPRPSLIMAVTPIAATIVLMVLQLIVFDAFTPHVPLVLGIAICGLLARTWGYRWPQLENGLWTVVRVGLPSVAILITVGMIIGTWILAGTVPTMIFYGLKTLNPGIFLLAAMLICSVVSLATGTSWGTIGTVGVALVGIGGALDVPMALTGGAVVSGGYFGDKVSPLSDTTNLAPAVCEQDVFPHIRNLLATTLPSMVAAGAAYFVLGRVYAERPMVTANIDLIAGTLAQTFRLSPLLLVPPCVVIAMAAKRMPALPTLFTGAILGGAAAMLGQGSSLHEVFTVMQTGYVSSTGVAAVDQLLTKGGIQSMMWVVSLVLIALGFGGILETSRCLEVLLDSILTRVKSRFALVAASTGTAVGLNVFAGDPYLAITLPGRMYAPAYRKMGLSTLCLSRSIEDGGTLVNPLVPWNAGGGFVAGALGIPTFVYAPCAFACWISPLIGILYGATGWFMPEAPLTQASASVNTPQKPHTVSQRSGVLPASGPTSIKAKRVGDTNDGPSERPESAA